MWKIRRKISKFIIIISIIMLIFNSSAYAINSEKDENGKVINHVTVEEVGDAVALFAQNFIAKYNKQTKYGSGNSYKGNKSDDSGKYEFTESSFIEFVYHNATSLSCENSIKLAIGRAGKVSCGNNFEFVLGDPEDVSAKLDKDAVRGVAQSGDILFETGGKAVAIFVDGDIIYCYDSESEENSQTEETSPEQQTTPEQTVIPQQGGKATQTEQSGGKTTKKVKKGALKQVGLYPEDDEINKEDEEEQTEQTEEEIVPQSGNPLVAEQNLEPLAGEDPIPVDNVGGKAKVYGKNKDEQREYAAKQTGSDDEENFEEGERTKFLDYCAIARVTEAGANSIEKAGDVTTLFKENDKEAIKYSKFYGTTEGSYIGATDTNILAWLFDKLIGFFDYLLGMILLIIRMPFIGWANILENMVNDTINNVSGVAITATPDEVDVQESDQKAISSEVPTARELYLSKRINIEDLIYNRVPFFDVDAFDVNFEKFDGQVAIEKDSILYKIKEGVGTWYFSFRNLAIVALLLILVYTGIRMAITSSGERKANYKKQLIGWVTAMVVVFLVHYFMIFVNEGNNVIVNFCRVENAKVNGGLSMYDTVRTRAYSMKMSEGVPATLIYMVLIYFLIKYIFVYLRRYITVNILTIIAPVMAAKYALDYANSGRSGSLSAWMYDYAFNVLLQSVHALLYTVLITIAFKMAQDSLAGFVLCLVILSFVFDAEKIFMKIFKFNDAKSLDSVNEDKHYIKDAIGLYYGARYYTKGVLRFGGAAVKGTAGFVGTGALALTQAGVDFATRKSDKDIDIIDAFNSAKGKVFSKIDDGFYNLTGDRSLLLNLDKLKETDPVLYKRAKKAMESNSKYKKEVLSRSLKNGIAPVLTMAKIFTGIPMAIMDPKNAIPVLAADFSKLKSESANTRRYGHASKKEIKGRRGRTIANIATLGIYGSVANNVETLNKDLEKVRKNQKQVTDFRSQTTDMREAKDLLEEVRELDNNINPEIEGKDVDLYKKLKAEMIKSALNSVVSGGRISEAVKSYMKKNNLKSISAADMPGILAEFNLQNIEFEIKSLDEYTDELQSDVDKIKESIQEKAEIVKEEQDNLKALNEQKFEDEKERTRLEKEIKDRLRKAEKEKKKLEKEKHDKEEKLEDKKQEKEIIKQVEAKLKSDDQIGEVMYSKIKDAVREYKQEKSMSGKSEKLEKDDVDKIVEKIKENGTSLKDKAENRFSEEINKNSNKPLNQKQAVNAILDAIEDQAKENMEEKMREVQGDPKYGNISVTFNELNDLSQKTVELKTKREKLKNTYGTRAKTSIFGYGDKLW